MQAKLRIGGTIGEIVAILKLMAEYERVQKEVRDARRTNEA